MKEIEVIDLNFRDEKKAIASFLIHTACGVVLVDSGPMSTFSDLTAALNQLGYSPNAVHAVLLTHVHFDHAGAAWQFAALGAKIYVHPLGIPHLINPKKLWNSASQIFGVKEMDFLWGPMKPIAVENIVAAIDGQVLDFGNVQF